MKKIIIISFILQFFLINFGCADQIYLKNTSDLDFSWADSATTDGYAIYPQNGYTNTYLPGGYDWYFYHSYYKHVMPADWVALVYQFHTSDGTHEFYAIVMQGAPSGYTIADNFQNTPPLSDTDGDGIPDNYDLAPNSPDNPQWKMISQTKNIATGEIVSALIQTDSGVYIRFGEKPEDMTGFQDYLSIGSQFRDNSELQETLEAGSYQGSTSSTQTSEQVMSELNSSSLAVNNASIPDVPDDFQNQGETVSDTSQTDTTTLQSTQNNTAQIVTNTAQTGAYLKAINDNLKTLNTLTATGAGQVSQGLSKNDIKLGVTDALNDDSVDVPDNSSVSDAMTAAQNTIKGDASLTDDAPDEYKTKTDIVAKMADYISNNPLTNIITGSQIQCSGAVSHIESDLYGHSISFDLAPYSSQLQVFGQMLLAITTLAGMLLIFRK